MDPSNQIHDFNPGIAVNGLFWTLVVPPDAVQVNLKTQTASFAYDSLTIEDYGTFANAIMDGPSHKSTVSFDVEWSGMTSRIAVRNPSEGFKGIFFEDTATIEWSASSPDQNFTFTSDAASTSTSVFAEIGVERNGMFFR